MPVSQTMITFAINVKLLLKAQGLTQRELAGRIGWSEQQVSDLLNRQTNTTIETVAMIAEALLVSPGSLLDRKPG